ncbi:MAG: hypothetical protein ACRC3B_05465 [Bacteroidia bacterium]
MADKLGITEEDVKKRFIEGNEDFDEAVKDKVYIFKDAEFKSRLAEEKNIGAGTAYGKLEDDAQKLFGIPKNTGEKALDYIKRAYETKTLEVTEALKKSLAKPGDEFLKKDLEAKEKALQEWQSKYSELDKSVKQKEVTAEFAKVYASLPIAGTGDEKQAKVDYLDYSVRSKVDIQTDAEGKTRYINKATGEEFRTVSTGAPMSLKQIVELVAPKDVFEVKKGAGGSDGGNTDKPIDIKNMSSFAAYATSEDLEKHLIASGISKYSQEYRETVEKYVAENTKAK